MARIPAPSEIGFTNMSGALPLKKATAADFGGDGGLGSVAAGIGAMAGALKNYQAKQDNFAFQKHTYDQSGDWERQYTEMRNGIAPNAEGYDDKVTAAYDKWEKNFLAKAPSSMRQKAELFAARKRAGIGEQIVKDVLRERGRYETESVDDMIRDAAMGIQKGEMSVNDAISMIDGHLGAASHIDNATRDKLHDGLRRRLQLAHLETATLPELQSVAAGGSTDPATNLIVQKEGFRTNAYWDVDHWRVGYGSDTITHPDGTVEKVTQHTTTDRAGADRDIARRIPEFQKVAINKVGQKVWDQYDANTQAALTSVVYNYGRLPDGVAAAMRTGDKAKVAASVRHLGDIHKPINKKRRYNEAAIIDGQVQIKGGGVKYTHVSPQEVDRQIRVKQKEIQAAHVDGLWSRIEGGDVQFMPTAEEITADDSLTRTQTSQMLKAIAEAEHQAAGAAVVDKIMTGEEPVRLNPMDKDQRSYVDAAIEKGAALNDVVEATGLADRKTFDRLQTLINSNEPGQVLDGVRQLSTLRQWGEASPAGSGDVFAGIKGADKLYDTLDRYDWMVNHGYREQAIAQELSRPPLTGREKDALLKDFKDDVKEIATPGTVADLFGGTVDVDEVPDSVVVEYRDEYLKQALIETGGNMTLAQAYAGQRFRKMYGPSPMAQTNAVMLAPVEAFYPAQHNPDDPSAPADHSYMHREFQSEMAKRGFTEVNNMLIHSEADITLKDIKAGKRPRYMVTFMDQNGFPHAMPFRFDVQTETEREGAKQSYIKEQKRILDRYKQQVDENRQRIEQPFRPDGQMPFIQLADPDNGNVNAGN